MFRSVDFNKDKGMPLNVPKGYYLYVTASTMASYLIHFTIRGIEGGKVYFNEQRSCLSPLPPLSAFFQSDCGDMELTISIPQSKQIDARVNTEDLTDEKGELIIRMVNVLGEDWTDKDYNDFMVTVYIMKSRV